MSAPATERERIAVIGAGVAGLTAAWLLQRRADVELFERNDYIGGHTRTIVIREGPDAGTPVDMGFIVMNHRNYPLLTRLFETLGISLGDSDMSFGYHCRATGYAYCGSGLAGIFARASHLFNRAHWRMLKDIVRFNRDVSRDLDRGILENETIGGYLDRGRYSDAFARHYLLAMGGAIWSSPADTVRDFPLRAFANFFRNHGLLSLNDRPQWRYVIGGSQTYVRAMLDGFGGRVHTHVRLAGVRREPGGVCLRFADGREARFARVVFGAHADETLAMLDDPTPQERRLLGAWRYQANHAILHTDAGSMPPSRRAWASWNVTREQARDGEQPVSITYHMNRLQRLQTQRNYFVSLNAKRAIEPGARVHAERFTHPVYTFDSMSTQAELRGMNGTGATLYCGAYLGHGFHEDAVRSAVDAVAKWGVTF